MADFFSVDVNRPERLPASVLGLYRSAKGSRLKRLVPDLLHVAHVAVKVCAVLLGQLCAIFLNCRDGVRGFVRVGHAPGGSRCTIRGETCADRGFFHRNGAIPAHILLDEFPLARGQGLLLLLQRGHRRGQPLLHRFPQRRGYIPNVFSAHQPLSLLQTNQSVCSSMRRTVNKAHGACSLR